MITSAVHSDLLLAYRVRIWNAGQVNRNLFFALFLPCIPSLTAATAPLSKLDLSQMDSGWGKPRAGKSVDGNPLKIGAREFSEGVGTQADSTFLLKLDGRSREFRAWVGIDSEVGDKGSVEFELIGDGRSLWKSGVMKGGQEAREAKVPLAGVKQLALLAGAADAGIDFDHADWADAVIEHDGAAPEVEKPVPEEVVILTPKPGPKPRLTGPRIFGARPCNPFLHRITATGDKPIKFSAEGLPPGITLDAATGRLTGVLGRAGTWDVKVAASNRIGSAKRVLRIVGGPRISLTPPMGWNSWNCFASAVTDTHIRDAARSMIESGLADHGWTYVNIDDFWQVKPSAKDDASLQGPERDKDGRIVPNPRFPDMKGLAGHVHDLGLKIGLYSSPGPLTCGGCVGSIYQEDNDAASYAEWGFDYLKHDWCSYNPGQEAKRAKPVQGADAFLSGVTDTKLRDLMVPYANMRAALDKQKRDIVYSLCQYGMGDVSAWGDKVGGNCWRTTGDINDSWSSMAGIGFAQSDHAKYATPGCWNDPDMLVVGHVGWGPSLHPTKLTPNEQYTHISLWCLLSSPLLIGCDLTKLDDFTLGLLTNDEVLEVNQDPLGKQATRLVQEGTTEVWGKPLADGSWAVGLFNRGILPANASFDLAKLGIGNKATVRDLWRQQDTPGQAGGLKARLPRHGCALFKVSRK